MKAIDILKTNNIPFRDYVLHKDGGTACGKCGTIELNNHYKGLPDRPMPAISGGRKAIARFPQGTLLMTFARCAKCGQEYYIVYEPELKDKGVYIVPCETIMLSGIEVTDPCNWTFPELESI